MDWSQLKAKWAISLSLPVRLNLYRVVSRLIASGVPVHEIAERIAREKEGIPRSLKRFAQQWVLSLRSGRSVSEVFSRAVPQGEYLFVRAGEKAGDLGRGFEQARVFAEKQTRLKKEIMGALGKPIAYVVIIVGISVFMREVPYQEIEKAVGEATVLKKAPDYHFFMHHLYFLLSMVVGCLVATVVGFGFLNRFWKSPVRERLPVFRLTADLFFAMTSLSLASMIKSGVPFHESVTELRKSATSPYAQSRLEYMTLGLRKGLPPMQVMASNPCAPVPLRFLFRLYEKAANQQAVMEEMAEDISEYVITRIKTVFAQYVSNALLLVTAMVVGYMYMGLMRVTLS
jgi:type II secretory pathway component PulF